MARYDDNLNRNLYRVTRKVAGQDPEPPLPSLVPDRYTALDWALMAAIVVLVSGFVVWMILSLVLGA